MSDDSRINPKAGDRLFNYTRTVIWAKGDKVVFGVDIGDAQNCGAYVTSLAEWRTWAARARHSALNVPLDKMETHEPAPDTPKPRTLEDDEQNQPEE